MIDIKALLEKFQNSVAPLFEKLSSKGATNENAADNSPSAIRRKQWKYAGVTVLIFLAVILIFNGLLTNDDKPKKISNNKSDTNVEPIKFTSPVADLDKKNLWLENAENKLNKEDTTTKALKKISEQQLAKTNLLEQKDNAQSQAIAKMLERMNALQAKVNTLEAQKKAVEKTSTHQNTSRYAHTAYAAQAMPINTFRTTVLALAPKPTKAKKPLPKTPKYYIPAGAYVQSVLISGLEASAGVNAQSNPRPVLIRTVGDAVLPDNKHSKLKNCRLLGAGYGDISSERAYIRLESMTCIKEGKTYDYPVYGYVSGADGKVGIRGHVVMRDAALVGRAFVGGVLSGFGDSVSDNYTETSINPLGSTETVKDGESLEYGAAQGVSNAADMYADYNIKRAEQYQPVIEVPAGSIIDVVFTKSFYKDGTTTKENDKTKKAYEKAQQTPVTRINAMAMSTPQMQGMVNVQGQSIAPQNANHPVNQPISFP